MMRARPRKVPRRGIALLWVLVIIVLTSAILSATMAKTLAGRRLIEQRQHELQADWLARSGLEIAAARLLTTAGAYQGETTEPIPSSVVRIRVESLEDKPGAYHVTSEARYPNEGRFVVVREITRTFQRKVAKDLVSLEVIAAP
jgi:hypothetical protein